MVLLPEADCWTKATKQKPTNPTLARIKACRYMVTLTVVLQHHFRRIYGAPEDRQTDTGAFGVKCLLLFPLSPSALLIEHRTIPFFLLFLFPSPAAYLSLE